MAVYVVSDIHGLKDRYDKMKAMLKDEDHVYILGDVIDRGPDGIAILSDIMEQEKMTMLLGNHEFMMMQYYQAIYDDRFDPYTKSIIVSRWYRNHCAPTMAAFKKLSAEKQMQMLSFIHELPIAICDLTITNQKYYLVHGCPDNRLDQGVITMQDAWEAGISVEHLVWDRVMEETAFFDDRCVIVGHTPTIYLQDETPYAVWCGESDISQAKIIDIDCGCAVNNRFSQLAVLCLDDRSVIYI